MTADFDGLVAAVTGGASGIGRATADLLLERGARVAVLDLRPPDEPGDLRYVRCDVTDSASTDAAVAEVVDAFGGLDVLINNAGIAAVGTVEDNDPDEWHRVLDVNVVGMARMAKAAMPHLRRSSHAAIVNTGSFVATTGTIRRALYAASKGSVHALTLAMAADHVHEGVRVNCVEPGTAETPWIKGLLARAEDPASERARLEGRQPLGRMIAPEEVASAIAFLASPLNSSITGTVLAVDGGIVGVRFS
jgi:NAD(P)-dependent dehydrogenase (short-subunit alcohol dehydrogenase family)